MTRKNTLLIFLTLLLSFLGFLDATYLTIVHFKHIIPPCSIAHGCETVLTSQFATIGPIPIALLGSLFYVTIMILLGLLLQFQKTQNTQKSDISDSLKIRKSESLSFPSVLKKLLLVLTTSALIVSVILVYLQAFVIHAFCQYCLTSEGINLLLFITTVIIKYTNKRITQ